MVTVQDWRTEIARKDANCIVPSGAISCRNWPNFAMWIQWLWLILSDCTIAIFLLLNDKVFIKLPVNTLSFGIYEHLDMFFYSPRNTNLGCEYLKFHYENTVRVSCENCDLFALWSHFSIWSGFHHQVKFPAIYHEFSWKMDHFTPGLSGYCAQEHTISQRASSRLKRWYKAFAF